MKRGAVFLFLFGLIITACSGGIPQAQVANPQVANNVEEPTPIPILPSSDALVVQGHLVPGASIPLSFSTKGKVGEVLVQEGAPVKAGDIIARLMDQEELDAKVADAKLDLVSARQNYDDIQAGLPEEQTNALEDLSTAQETLRQMEAQLGSISNPAPPSANQIEIARANVAIAEKALNKATNDYRPFANKPEDNITRATLLQKLSSAQDRYNRALVRLNSLLGMGSTPGDGVDQAQSQLTIAQARVDEAQAKYDLLLQGPDPKEIETANARIEAAETALTAAQAAVKKLELRAPMDGTVVNLDLAPGQYVSEGQVVLTIVDLSRWYIETDSLVENQVVKISTGQGVTVVPDSLPDIQMKGVVEAISTTYQEKQGKILYTARIHIDNVDPRLRWGMKAEASFETPVAQK